MTTEPQTELTAEECFESLTGYEEIAITRAFGREITDLAEHSPMMFARALVFAMLRRDDTPDPEAKSAVMGMPISEVNGYFTEEPDDLDPDDPDTEAGKESTSPGASPAG